MRVITVLSFGLLVLNARACYKEIDETKQDINWWKTSVIYQVYPRSFKDSNGDGIGDLKGITEKLDHLVDAGIDALWLSPIYASPQKDFGYDISNFTDIAPEYGTLQDFDNLVKKAKSLKLKVLLDFVPNHSSHEHEWFKKSVEGIEPYKDYYIWRDGKKDSSGKIVPPNNWLSVFGDSAWEWNDKRKQYYYHAFVAGQPDLNYRNSILDQEMKNVILFWMRRGVDGFRVDAVNYLFEDENLTDEPKSEASNVPENDYDYLNHIYTRDLGDMYKVVDSWQKLIDYYVRNWGTDGKVMILEAYTSMENSIKFYEFGANPFNFMFVTPLGKTSTAFDFKNEIDNWLKAIPANKVPNWVVGNHDNHRVASRYGTNNNREDQITMLATMLPGITVIYNGDEIGMVDREFTWEETVDPAGCNAGKDRYQLKSRDPERTPFQWDDTTSAGFSSNATTWLPVHDNYKTLNLAAQKKSEVSHYKVFQALTKLKKTDALLKGHVRVEIADDDGNVLAVIREQINGNPVVLLINFNEKPVTIDAKTILNTPDSLEIHIASVKSTLKAGEKVDTSKITLPGAASVILK